jgi:hypothetical protein
MYDWVPVDDSLYLAEPQEPSCRWSLEFFCIVNHGNIYYLTIKLTYISFFFIFIIIYIL